MPIQTVVSGVSYNRQGMNMPIQTMVPGVSYNQQGIHMRRQSLVSERNSIPVLISNRPVPDYTCNGPVVNPLCGIHIPMIRMVTRANSKPQLGVWKRGQISVADETT